MMKPYFKEMQATILEYRKKFDENYITILGLTNGDYVSGTISVTVDAQGPDGISQGVLTLFQNPE